MKPQKKQVKMMVQNPTGISQKISFTRTMHSPTEKTSMRQITFQLRCDLEERLRKHTGRKGELSKVLNEAVKMWLDKEEGCIVPIFSEKKTEEKK